MPRAGNIDYEVERARMDAEADYYGRRAESAAFAASTLLVCAVLFLLMVVGVRIAKAWGYLQ